jgi:hypothetical protein
MNRRSLLKFLSFLPFAPLLGRKVEAAAIPNMEDDLAYWRRKIEYCGSVGDHKKADLYRKRLLLAKDAALIRDTQRARNGRKFSMHVERVGRETFCATIPADLSPQEAMEYLDSIKRHFRRVGYHNARGLVQAYLFL